jgi:hypothetical protein
VLPAGTVPAFCDVAEPACIGPFVLPGGTTLTPEVVVTLETSGAAGSAVPSVGNTVGPIPVTVPVPVIGDVTLTLCPDGCPLPVEAHGTVGGEVHVTWSVDGDEQSLAVPIPAVSF